MVFLWLGASDADMLFMIAKLPVLLSFCLPSEPAIDFPLGEIKAVLQICNN